MKIPFLCGLVEIRKGETKVQGCLPPCALEMLQWRLSLKIGFLWYWVQIEYARGTVLFPDQNACSRAAPRKCMNKRIPTYPSSVCHHFLSRLFTLWSCHCTDLTKNTIIYLWQKKKANQQWTHRFFSSDQNYKFSSLKTERVQAHYNTEPRGFRWHFIRSKNLTFYQIGENSQSKTMSIILVGNSAWNSRKK